MRDGLSSKQIKALFPPAAAVTDNTPFVSAIIDLQGFDVATLAFIVGTNNDSNMTAVALLEEGDASNLSDAAAVADADMVSQTAGTAPETAASFQYNDDGEVRSIGYIGSKRYIRLTVTPSGNSGDQYLAGVAVLERAAHGPIAHAQS